MWGFDSFLGLPSTEEVVPHTWQRGAYSSDPRRNLIRQLGPAVGFIAGFYNESLRDDGIVSFHGLEPARYVDIDVDLYGSAFDALDFMFRNGLMVQGTLLGYDDWWVLPCLNKSVQSPLDAGEGRAHREIATKYDVEFECLAGGCLSLHGPNGHVRATNGWGALFAIRSIGRGRCFYGFNMTSAEVQLFRKLDHLCIGHGGRGRRRRRPA